MKHIIVLTSFLITALSFAKDKPTQFINQWKATAVNQMMIYKIPASITMAQAILESGYGKSKLAVNANNYFGIKCHTWNGKTFYKDDDRPNECFRKYDNPSASFVDHSLFLVNQKRYDFLFELKITDYKGWAKGLKKAGYATSRDYARKLIDIIKRYDLQKLDEQNSTDLLVRLDKKEEQKSKLKSSINTISSHQVFVNDNRTKYVIANEHDTFYLIAKEFGLNLRQLARWNDFPPTKDVLNPGDKVYIMRKRNHVSIAKVRIKIKEGQSLWDIAQDYGIQLDALLKINNLVAPIAMNNGDIVYLK